MNGLLNNSIFNILMLITIGGEFILPWILKHFYKGYDSKRMVMSVLGSPESPVRKIYNIWLVWLGSFLCVTAVVLFLSIRNISLILSILIFSSVIIFAVGAGILSGIFSVNESKNNITLSSKIHGFSSAVGFMALLFFPLLSSITAFKSDNQLQGIICISAFLLSLLFFIFFIMGDKEQFKNSIFSYEGLWERLTLFFMYFPLICMAVQNLII